MLSANSNIPSDGSPRAPQPATPETPSSACTEKAMQLAEEGMMEADRLERAGLTKQASEARMQALIKCAEMYNSHLKGSTSANAANAECGKHFSVRSPAPAVRHPLSPLAINAFSSPETSQTLKGKQPVEDSSLCSNPATSAECETPCEREQLCADTNTSSNPDATQGWGGEQPSTSTPTSSGRRNKEEILSDYSGATVCLTPALSTTCSVSPMLTETPQEKEALFMSMKQDDACTSGVSDGLPAIKSPAFPGTEMNQPLLYGQLNDACESGGSEGRQTQKTSHSARADTPNKEKQPESKNTLDLNPTYAYQCGGDERGASPDAMQFEASLLRPVDLQGVLISGTKVVRHLQERPFGLYELHVPLCSSEHVVFRRYSDFVALDAELRELMMQSLRLPCCATSELPSLPHRTAFWQDATSPSILSRRWGALQLYLDAVLDIIVMSCPEGCELPAWLALKRFLSLA